MSEEINDKDLYEVFRLFKEKKFSEAESLIKSGISRSHSEGNKEVEGLFESTYGMLFKLKQDYKKAYKHYQKAERLIPDDPALKIINAELLIEQFKQYDTAARKLEKTKKSHADNAVVLHRVLALQGMALYLQRKKNEARSCLESMVAQDFTELQFAANLDFKLVEVFAREGSENDLCKAYLKKALELAKAKQELGFINAIHHLLAGFD
jgi:uncharacterized membrane-anchored protein YhcB (DUF1043 family)